jgi:hypothetical protein
MGILAIPLMYRWLVDFFDGNPDRHWLGLIAAAGLTFSFWHTAMSRIGYRTAFLPPFVILTAYLFWRGCQKRSLLYFAGAGVSLGLSQYTYLSARLLPLVYGLFALGWTILTRIHSPRSPVPSGFSPLQRRVFWPGLLVTAIASIIIFLPLGLFFLKTPVAFSTRSSEVYIINSFTQWADLAEHLLDSFRVFIDGSDPNWRHNLAGRPGFDLLNLVGFWVGLALTASRFRQPGHLFLLVSLFVLWLPAPLSWPATDSLRLSGLLPTFYALMAVGLMALARWATRRLSWKPAIRLAPITAFALVFIVSGGSTAYDYFVRWANEPLVYNRHDGPLVDLINHLVTESRAADVLLPFHTYVHPTARFLLHDEFREVDMPPTFTPGRPAILVTMPDTTSSAYVWLTRDELGQGIAYSIPQPFTGLDALETAGATVPFPHPYTAEAVAQLTPLESVRSLVSSPADWQLHNPADYYWGQEIRLVGYQVRPDWLQAGQPLTLDLYWQGLNDQTLGYKTFIHLVDARGDPVTQGDGRFLNEEYRWRAGGGIPDQYVLWIGPEVPPGPHLIRVGLFNPYTGKRIPIYGPGGEPLGDQMSLGLFYVTKGDTDPRLPQTHLQARLGDQVELLGYSLLPSQTEASILRVQLYWRADGRLDNDYTTFVQLLNTQNQLVTSWDSQPLAGQYPTSRWQPGEIVVDEVELPLQDKLLPDNYRLVAGMYDLATGWRLSATGADGQMLQDDMIPLVQMRQP